MEIENSYISIPDTYRNLTILITGGTGFLGKVLVEKLLRSCPELCHIYLLVRDKKGKSINERLDAIFQDPLFSILDEEQPSYRDKVSGISGDFNVKGLNINLEDKNKLISEVDIIFHGAAAVRFDLDLRSMYHINIRGTKDILELANQMAHLKAFIFISTAYSNCTHEHVNEMLYPPPMSFQDITDIIENTDDDVLNILEPKIIQDWPNNYTFSKAIVESFFEDVGKKLPVRICRPCIVVGTAYEPLVGWIDNMYGPVGMTVGVGKGVLHALLLDLQKKVDIVPVDMCVNALIAISWHTICSTNREVNLRKDQYTVPTDINPKSDACHMVYNFVSTQNPILWNDWFSYIQKHGPNTPLINSIWYPCYIITKSWTVYMILACLLHHLPALFIDNIAKLSGKKIKNLGKLYRKIDRTFAAVKYFSTKNWIFSDKNTQHLWKCLNAKDRQIFKFNIKKLDWNAYFQSFSPGLGQYLVKEDPKTIPAARMHYKRLYWLHQTTKALLLYFLYRITWFFASFFW